MLNRAFLRKSFIQSIDLDFDKMKLDLKKLYNGKISRWFQAMDLYDQGITMHTLRVTAISLELGRVLGLSKEDLVYIQFGTLLHDIGKLGIPDAIIRKPGKLTTEEYKVVQMHPIYADHWIPKTLEYQPARVIPLSHHERWDGTGYPYQLKGDEIPLLARVVAVADVWDAITSKRPYRNAMSNSQAIRLIKSESGSHFDPEVVDAFLKLGVHEKRGVPFTCTLIL